MSDKPSFIPYETVICTDFLNPVATAVWDALGKPQTASDVLLYIGAAPVLHTHTWDQITDTPLSFTPSPHTHLLVDVTNAGNSAGLNVGTGAGTVAAGDHNHDTVYDPIGSAATVQGYLNSHEANSFNPHGVTAVQVGADAVGSAAAVQTNLDVHTTDTANPHGVTAAQVGADVSGAASAVQGNLDTHTADQTNPHSVTAAQVGADPLGSADTVQGYLNSHEANASNPHRVTAAQVGAVTAVQAGTNVTIDNTDPAQPIVSVAASAGITDIVQDTTPQLGGSLDMNGFNINTGTYNITPAVLGYLNGVSSNIQTQLNGKLSSSTPVLHQSLNLNGWGLKADVGLISNTEIGYLDGVTSAIQSQLNGKANTVLSNISDAYSARANIGAYGNFSRRSAYGTAGASGTFVPQSDTRRMVVHLVGGGGGGGNVTGGGSGYGGASSAGGGGGYCVRVIDDPVGSFSYTVGSGGGPAIAGSSSVFAGSGVSMSANGGGGGVSVTSVTGPGFILPAGGIGGDVTSNGGIGFTGTPGEWGCAYYGKPLAVANGGRAAGPFGGGGSRCSDGGYASYGGGGGGTLSWDSSVVTYGRAGGGGLVVIDEYR